MNVTVKHLGGLAFAGIGQKGEVTTIVGGAETNSEHKGNSPMELVLMSVASCSGIDIVGMLEKMRVNFDRLEISVEGERAEDFPRVFTQIHVIYKFWGSELAEDKLRRAIDLSFSKYCSVINLVNKVAQVTYSIEIH